MQWLNATWYSASRKRKRTFSKTTKDVKNRETGCEVYWGLPVLSLQLFSKAKTALNKSLFKKKKTELIPKLVPKEQIFQFKSNQNNCLIKQKKQLSSKKRRQDPDFAKFRFIMSRIQVQNYPAFERTEKIKHIFQEKRKSVETNPEVPLSLELGKKIKVANVNCCPSWSKTTYSWNEWKDRADKQRNRNYIKRTQMEITEVKQQYKSVLIGLITK